MDAKEAQLQYMHLYKEMDASYYALSCAQQLVPSEMDIYYAITVLGDGCRQRDICALALTGKFIHLLQKQTAHLAPEFREKGEK